MSLSDTSAHHLNTFRDWASITYFPGKPMPVLNYPFHEGIFPNSQSQPPLVQFEAISPHPITCCLWDEVNPCLTRTSCQAVV